MAFKKKRSKALRPDQNPEKPKRSQIEVMSRLYLRGDPDIVDAIERVIEECGYQTPAEGARHLLRIAVAATPVDGEVRAAVSSVKSQMIRFFTTRYWTLLNRLIAEYEEEWRKIDGNVIVNREIAKFHLDQGRISVEEYNTILEANPL